MMSRSPSSEPSLEGDVRVNRLAEQLVGHADHGRLPHARDRVQRVLDLDRADLLAARLDDVVASAHEVEEALLVDREVVVGAEHALARERPFDEHLGRQRRAGASSPP